MSAGRWRCDRRLLWQMMHAVALALGCAALPTACGRGISLDPTAWEPPQNEKLDAADVLDSGRSDGSLDLADAQDATEEMDISTPPPDVSADWDVAVPPPDISEDARADGTETTEPDVGLDAFDGALPDSQDTGEDVGDDLADSQDRRPVRRG